MPLGHGRIGRHFAFGLSVSPTTPQLLAHLHLGNLGDANATLAGINVCFRVTGTFRDGTTTRLVEDLQQLLEEPLPATANVQQEYHRRCRATNGPRAQLQQWFSNRGQHDAVRCVSENGLLNALARMQAYMSANNRHPTDPWTMDDIEAYLSDFVMSRGRWGYLWVWR